MLKPLKSERIYKNERVALLGIEFNNKGSLEPSLEKLATCKSTKRDNQGS